MNPRREGMSGHHKVRWKVSRDLCVIEQEGGVLPPGTRLKHQADSEGLHQMKIRSDTQGQPGSQRRDREGPPRKSAQPRYCCPEPEGDWGNRELLHAKSSTEEQLPTSQTMCGRDGQVKPDRPTGPNSFPMRLSSRLDGRYRGAIKPRSRGDPVPSPQKPGRRGRTNHAQLWSDRLETKRTWSTPVRLIEARARRKSGDWARKRSSEDPKRNVQISRKPWRMRVTTPGGERNSWGSTGFEKFLGNTESFTRAPTNQVLQGKDREKGWLRARNWRDWQNLATM